MSITSDELNFLVYRYLQESGFVHTAFAFAYESLVTKSNIDGSHVPPGALITYLQKGLQYVEIESHLQPDGTEVMCDAPFSLTQPHVCRIIEAQPPPQPEPEQENGFDDAMSEDASDIPDHLAIPQECVTQLKGHTMEVFVCAWNPVSSSLASGSGDSTARIWPLAPLEGAPIVLRPKIVVDPNAVPEDESTKGVTTLDWSSDGSLLATGSYDGNAHIWTSTGQMKCALKEHKGPVFALKWNKQGNMLLSGSADNTAIIWDAKTGQVLQKFCNHNAPTLDVDWRDNDTFASCSTDRVIYVCRLGQSEPLREFTGHTDEVNAVRWDPQGLFLASCSDDFTVKIWRMDQASFVYNFTGHERDIFTIRWSPTGPGSVNPTLPLYLASASLDSTIRIWDVHNGTCLHSLQKHRDPMYSVAFSPDGCFLASGSCGSSDTSNAERGELQLWRLRDGALVRAYRGSGGIFEVCWNPAGDRVAACFSDSALAVIDLSNLLPRTSKQ